MSSTSWARLIDEVNKVEREQRKRFERREQIRADLEQVAKWDEEKSPPIIETHYAEPYGKLYLPQEGPGADLIFDWIAQTSDSITGKHTSLAGKRYVTFRKGDFRARLEIALRAIYPVYRRVSTHRDICNVSCREAYEIECECRCDEKHHQDEDYSDYRVVKHSHGVLVREFANDQGIYVDDDLIYSGASEPELPEEPVREYIERNARTEEHQWAYLYFSEAQTEQYGNRIITAIGSAIEARAKLVGELREAR